MLRLRLLYSINLLMKMSENIIFLLKLLRVFLYDTRLFAVNLIFDWVVTCNDNTQIKHFISESVLLIQQLYCLSALSTTVTSLLIRIDIKSSICHADLFSTKIRLELLFCVNVDQNCLRLDSWCFSELINIELLLWHLLFYSVCI